MTRKEDLLKKKKGEVIPDAKIESISAKKKPPLLVMIIIFVILFIFIVGAFTNLFFPSTSTQTEDNSKFIQEYENLNGKQDEEGNPYFEVSIENSVKVEYASYDQLEELLAGETGVVLLGMATSSPCRSLVPILLDAAWEIGLDRIYYIPVSEQELDLHYSEVIQPSTDQEFIDNQIFVPTLLIIKDGEVVDTLIGTSVTDSPSFSVISDEDRQEVKEALIEKLSLVITCSDAC